MASALSPGKPKVILSLIAAMDRNRVIGLANRMPWHLPADLRHFRELTLGKPIVMGRRTYESLGRALPGRSNIVVTRDRAFQPPDVIVAHTVEDALGAAGDAPEVMVIGGASFYAQCLARADRLYLTLIDAELAGDTYFPELDARQWREVSREDHVPDARNPWPYSFIVLERRPS